jgi:hypothetical protein
MPILTRSLQDFNRFVFANTVAVNVRRISGWIDLKPYVHDAPDSC